MTSGPCRTRYCGCFLWAAIACIPLLSGGVTHAADDAYYYSYFDEHVPLGLDHTRVAIQAAAGGDVPSLTDTLGSLGFDRTSILPMAIQGWAFAPTPQGVKETRDVEALVASLSAGQDMGFASPVFTDSRGLPLVITGDLLVGFHEHVTSDAAQSILATYVNGVIEESDFAGLAGVYRLQLASKNGFEVLALANALADLPEVKFAESDVIVRATISLIPNDPLFPDQWGLHQANDQDMDAPEAWDITTGSASSVVVILDCGIQQNHPDINQIPGQDFTGDGTVGGGPNDHCDMHGTCVAGCVSAVINNMTGVVGVAPDCPVRSARMGGVISFLGFCTPFMDSQPSYVADGLDWAVSIGASTTNSSFGYETSATMTTAYNNAHANGVVNFAATGNSGEGTISYPASLSSVVAVGALNSSGSKASFGQYGTGISFSAPGEAILTTDRTGSEGYDESSDYVTVDGTSFSSPYAAGVGALVMSQAPGLTSDEVEQVMSETCVDLGAGGYDTTYGWGFVNAYNAVLAVTASTPGDYNGDGNVNLDDYAYWDDCMTGPGAESVTSECEVFDFDEDVDVDLEDFAAFELAMS